MTLSYHSVKLIKVENTLLALIYYALVAGILTYVIVFSIYMKKGYQDIEILTASTMTKVKGSAFTLPPEYNETATSDFPIKELTVFDANDLVVPPMLPDSIFVTTNFIFTANQTRGVCAGNDDKLERCNCTKEWSKLNASVDWSQPESANDWSRLVQKCCSVGKHTNNGITTGRCAGDSADGFTRGEYCEIKAWCPLEVANPTKEQMRANVLKGTEDWTIFIRTNVKFPKWDITLSTAGGADHTWGVDLFNISYIVKKAQSDLEQVKEKGAIIVARFAYDCDFNSGQACTPDITFTRLDNSSVGALSTGFNYRDVSRYRQDGVETRDVHKYYGIHLLVQVYGKGGKFGVFPLFITLGSGAALLGVSTVICDVIMQYLAPARNKYVANKYHVVYDDEMDDTSRKRKKKTSIDASSDDADERGGGSSDPKETSVVIRRANKHTVQDDDKPYEPLSPVAANEEEYTTEHSRLLS